jgi:hypothetical protein
MDLLTPARQLKSMPQNRLNPGGGLTAHSRLGDRIEALAAGCPVFSKSALTRTGAETNTRLLGFGLGRELAGGESELGLQGLASSLPLAALRRADVADSVVCRAPEESGPLARGPSCRSIQMLEVSR